MTTDPTHPTPTTFNPTGDFFLDDEFLFDGDLLFDDERFANDFGIPAECSVTLSEEDLRFLRDFILNSAMYVEQLENLVCEGSDDFWQAREHAYRVITNALIGIYEYDMEE